ncbi:TraR/DksA C4-type zinc finger protein [Psychrobacter sp. T6-1]|uniref:TraR/DksA C4-type zinc finger protein n=1 Tax=Psychrobacter sp. T6-1 TaxID=3457447 RepID=UPI003FD174C0
MTEIIEAANKQAQAEIDAILSHTKLSPANSIYDCVDCESPIGIPRKTAIPWAIRCITCQDIYEKGKR